MREKSDHQQAVEAFMRKAKQTVREYPTSMIPEAERILSAKLLMEECIETIVGLGILVRVPSFNGRGVPAPCNIEKDRMQFDLVGPQDIVEVIDGVADVHVIATGIAARYGVIEAPVIAMVDENNMAKHGPGSSVREDGKLVKPPGHNPPDIAGELKRQTEYWQLAHGEALEN